MAPRKHIYKMRLIFLFLYVALYLQSCSKSDLNLFKPSTWFPNTIDNNTTNSLPLTSPENTLKNLIISYNTRNIILYSKLISEDYRFYMSTTLTGSYNSSTKLPDPTIWISEITTEINKPIINYYINKKADIKSVSSLFTSTGTISDISLEFEYSIDTVFNDTANAIISNIKLSITQQNPYEIFTISDEKSSVKTKVILYKNSKTREWVIYRWFDATIGTSDDDM